jgi:thioredoxin-dependent peroxiredoxin
MRFVLSALTILGAAAIGMVLLRPRGAQAAMLKVGDQAPNFAADAIVGDQSVPVHLVDYRGRRVVLYFYPKDNTPGCSKEACAFRDGYVRLQSLGVTVFGCSIDGADSHRAFAWKYKLPFPLLLDPDKKIAKAYGADNGIPILGLDRRITYVIGEDGRVVAVYPQVDPGTHAAQIMKDLAARASPPAPSASATPTASEPSSGTVGATSVRPDLPASDDRDLE